MEDLQITAKINSFITSDPWSPSIDSIIAYWHLFEKMGAEEFHLSASTQTGLKLIDDLPLDKFEWKNDIWWWKCSSPVYDIRHMSLKYIHRRFDQHDAESYMKPKKGNISTTAGPYKNFRGGFNQIVADHISWFAIGDKDEITRLLNRCTNIGAKSAAGFGQVKEWVVTENPESAELCMKRPVPLEFADQNNIAYSSVLEWAFRPPFRMPANKIICAMP